MERRGLLARCCWASTRMARSSTPGRKGTRMPVKVLADLRRRLDPIARKASPLSVAPSRKTRFGSPLVLSRVHWVEPKLVAEITYLTWTADGLLRHTSGCGRTSGPSRCGRRIREVNKPRRGSSWSKCSRQATKANVLTGGDKAKAGTARALDRGTRISCNFHPELLTLNLGPRVANLDTGPTPILP